MLQKVENLLKKFWKGIVILIELIIISIFVIDSLNSKIPKESIIFGVEILIKTIVISQKCLF